MRETNPFVHMGMRKGLRKGLQRGVHQGRKAELVLRQLKRRFGRLSAAQEEAIRNLSLPKTEILAEALLDFTSRPDLTRWLRANKKYT